MRVKGSIKSDASSLLFWLQGSPERAAQDAPMPEVILLLAGPHAVYCWWQGAYIVAVKASLNFVHCEKVQESKQGCWLVGAGGGVATGLFNGLDEGLVSKDGPKIETMQLCALKNIRRKALNTHND